LILKHLLNSCLCSDFIFLRIVSEFAPPPEVKLKPGALQRNDRTKPNIKDAGRGRGHGRGSAESDVDESQFVQMKSVFSEGPMTAQASVNNTRLYSGKFCCCVFVISFEISVLSVTKK